MCSRAFTSHMIYAAVIAVCFVLPLSPAFSQRLNQEFSADVVSNVSGHETTSRYYASKGRIRQEHSRNGVPGLVLIVDSHKNTAWELMPQQKMAINMSSAVQSAKDGASKLGVGGPPDPTNPCGGVPDCTATKLGTEMVNGRQTQKWEMKWGRDRQSVYMWVDPSLPLAIKTRWQDGSITEFRNIKEGPQPDSLFQVPSDYNTSP